MSTTTDKKRNIPMCSLNLIGASNNSVIPEMKIIAIDEKANHIVTKLKEQASSINVKTTVKTSQNHGDNTNL
jgi:hypothetical protein